MQKSSQRESERREARGTERSLARRAELIAVGRKLFADTAYDVLSMDDIAQQAGVAKGLIYYYFKSKRGYYLAIIEDTFADLVTSAAGEAELPNAERVSRTIEGYLRYAELHQAAFRTITRGGIGFDTEVQALRDGVHHAIIGTIAQGAYGRTDIPEIARLSLYGWLCSVEGMTLDWIAEQKLSRATVRDLMVRLLGDTLRTIAEFEPSCPPLPRTDVLPSRGKPHDPPPRCV
ncbi:TetR/AcrR family transcriptional regulator [Streptomyces sp. NA04227]|uniref:TetR/AcrR family transcriptional regulator n=1 Tax=Streptomyces sp. NA04227 TaxID=2742136 RepID=UPI0015903081|nr:TetR/AcrR family transcriptional regulator [Streptomyces sp. NA04227]QKW05444.1 TetR/AcrR family transcriptional regulator [Streptomyces sp. NA04227]